MGKSLRLTYSDGHPVFDREGLGFGRELNLKFGRCYFNDVVTYLVLYSLQLSPDGCSIQKNKSSGYDGYFRNGHWVLGQHYGVHAVLMSEHDPMILEMALRINLAIGKRDTLDLSKYMDIWSERDKHFDFAVRDEGRPWLESSPDFRIKPIPIDYGLDFREALPELQKEKYWQLCHLHLTFRDGHPVFDHGFERYGFGLGRRLILKFGLCLEGDFFVPLVTYSLLLSPDGCSIEKHVSEGYDGQNLADTAQISAHDPLILEMAQRINLVIGKEDTLDLSAYMDSWFKRDNYFDFLVIDSLLLRASSPDYQKEPIPNDYGKEFWEAVPKSKIGISGPQDGGENPRIDN